MATIQTLVGEGCFDASLKSKINSNFSAINDSTPTISSGTSAPSSTPGKVGDIYVKTDTAKVYIATGKASSSDWTLVN